MLDFLGNLVGAGLSYLGGRETRDQQINMFNQQMHAQDALSREQIQRRVADAKAAGVHPLYALGAQGFNFSPVSVGGLENPLGDMGQDISRAMSALKPAEDRVSDTAKAAEGLRLRNMELQNELLQAQVRKINSTTVPPPARITPELDIKPPEAPVGKEEASAHKRLIIGGTPFEPDPHTSPGQDIEDTLGDEGAGAYLVKNWAQYHHLKYAFRRMLSDYFARQQGQLFGELRRYRGDWFTPRRYRE